MRREAISPPATRSEVISGPGSLRHYPIGSILSAAGSSGVTGRRRAGGSPRISRDDRAIRGEVRRWPAGRGGKGQRLPADSENAVGGLRWKTPVMTGFAVDRRGFQTVGTI